VYHDKKLVLVIPAYNEASSIGQVLDAVPSYVDRVVVVDDGSQDDTGAIAVGHGAGLIKHGQNRGVGAALRTGISEALRLGADVMVNMDGDGQFDAGDIPKLVDPILSGEADFVTASRFMDRSLRPRMSRIKFFGNRFMSFFISRVTGQRLRDVSCGFRAYSKDTLLRLNLFGDFTYTQETFIDLTFKGLVIKEVPLKVAGKRKHGRSRVASNLFRYGYNTFKVIFRAYRDYKPLKLFFLFFLLFCFLGLITGGFLLLHYFSRGMFSPHKWAGFVSGFFFILALLMFLIGIILDMFARMRLNQEEMLYLLRQQRYFKGETKHPPAGPGPSRSASGSGPS